jgi:hypothetical protein
MRRRPLRQSPIDYDVRWSRPLRLFLCRSQTPTWSRWPQGSAWPSRPLREGGPALRLGGVEAASEAEAIANKILFKISSIGCRRCKARKSLTTKAIQEFAFSIYQGLDRPRADKGWLKKFVSAGGYASG